MAEVKIYWGEFHEKALDKTTVSRLNNILPPDFHLDLEKIKKPAAISFFAKMMLNDIIEKDYALKNALSSFQKDSNGKPSLQNENLHFNISHSKNIVAIAISEIATIGIDVQYKKSFSPAVIPKVFSESELKVYQQEQNPTNFFFDTWSKKEASVKATGNGIKTGLSSFSVLQKQLELDNHQLHLESFEIIEGYSAAIALNHPISSIKIEKSH